jgi:hypothetical protein
MGPTTDNIRTPNLGSDLVCERESIRIWMYTNWQMDRCFFFYLLTQVDTVVGQHVAPVGGRRHVERRVWVLRPRRASSQHAGAAGDEQRRRGVRKPRNSASQLMAPARDSQGHIVHVHGAGDEPAGKTSGARRRSRTWYACSVRLRAEAQSASSRRVCMTRGLRANRVASDEHSTSTSSQYAGTMCKHTDCESQEVPATTGMRRLGPAHDDSSA